MKTGFNETQIRKIKDKIYYVLQLSLLFMPGAVSWILSSLLVRFSVENLTSEEFPSGKLNILTSQFKQRTPLEPSCLVNVYVAQSVSSAFYVYDPH